MSLEVFIAYSHQDTELCDALGKHLSELKRQGIISSWSDGALLSGAEWEWHIRQHLNTAQIILLLVSADFMASDFSYSAEMARALERHQADEARVIPILLRPADWQGAPFAVLQVLPRDGKPVVMWPTLNGALAHVMQGIRAAINNLARAAQIASSSAVGMQPGTLWNVPYARNPLFMGREELLAHLSVTLQTGQAVALSQPFALSGLGGIGKTQLAVEYAYQHRQDYRAVFWMRADTRENLISDFLAMAEELKLPERGARDVRQTVFAAQVWLQSHHDWLLILDNADDLALAREFIPSMYGGQLLLTTRAQAMGRLDQRMEVDAILEEISVLFLLRRAGLIAPDTSLEHVPLKESEQTYELVQELGGLPLALEQAGAYMQETLCGVEEYLRLYRLRRTMFLNRSGWMIKDYPASVTTTCSLAFASVEQTHPAAADLLRVCAFLHPDAIPERLLRQGVTQMRASGMDDLAFHEAMRTLEDYSLLRRDLSTHTLSIHRLVQAVLIDAMSSESVQAWVERATRLVRAALPEVTFTAWAEWERLLPHALACVAHLQHAQFLFPEAAQLLRLTGWYLGIRGQYAEAEPLLQQALVLFEQHQGREHLDTAHSLVTLGWLYEEQGKNVEAEPLLQRALTIFEQQLGPTHPKTASSLNNLAALYKEQEKYAEAEPLLRRALAINEQQLGPTHSDTATSLNNLAALYEVQGKYAEAKLLYQRALAIYEQQMGREHAETKIVYENYTSFLQRFSPDDEQGAY
ncbi:MAG TPA: FxSxx-COOH system tetratricopeptide repeat protein [Ktedonobacteraceae bacterium]|nr:FxSxx-COOH system tetratricopeptide repeat protein [Ktedonobacteraceae bacterium]